MTARLDKNLILLGLINNEIATRGDQGLLPRDMQGDTILTQIHEHENALQTHQSANNTADGERERAIRAFAMTATLLTRIRYAILAALARNDERVAAFGPLGATQKAHQNLIRLEALIPKIAAALEAGELSLPPELQPDSLTAQARLHADLAKSKAGKITSRQVGSETLHAERQQTRTMVRRLKSFVKAHYGEKELTSFGFNLPLPPRRPRLAGETAEHEPAGEVVANA